MTQELTQVSTVPSPNDEAFKSKRFEKIMDKKMEDFVKATQTVLEHEQALIFEVEELKTLRKTLKQEIEQIIHTELDRSISSFAKQVRPLMEGPLNALQTIHVEANRTASTLKSTAIQSRNRLILLGVSLVTSVCFSCYVLAIVFFYFFPQKVSVNYDVNMEQIHQIIYGKTVMNNFKKLKPEDQALIEKATERIIKQMVSRKNFKP